MGGGGLIVVHFCAFLIIQFVCIFLHRFSFLCAPVLSTMELSRKMHPHKLPLLKMSCRMMRYFQHPKMTITIENHLLPNDKRPSQIMVPRAQCKHIHTDMQQTDAQWLLAASPPSTND